MNPSYHHAANPFALLTDPQTVFRAIERSERLERLQSRICRPLDKPVLPVVPAEEAAPSASSSFDDIELPGEEI